MIVWHSNFDRIFVGNISTFSCVTYKLQVIVWHSNFDRIFVQYWRPMQLWPKRSPGVPTWNSFLSNSFSFCGWVVSSFSDIKISPLAWLWLLLLTAGAARVEEDHETERIWRIWTQQGMLHRWDKRQDAYSSTPPTSVAVLKQALDDQMTPSPVGIQTVLCLFIWTFSLFTRCFGSYHFLIPVHGNGIPSKIPQETWSRPWIKISFSKEALVYGHFVLLGSAR